MTLCQVSAMLEEQLLKHKHTGQRSAWTHRPTAVWAERHLVVSAGYTCSDSNSGAETGSTNQLRTGLISKEPRCCVALNCSSCLNLCCVSCELMSETWENSKDFSATGSSIHHPLTQWFPKWEVAVWQGGMARLTKMYLFHCLLTIDKFVKRLPVWHTEPSVIYPHYYYLYV